MTVNTLTAEVIKQTIADLVGAIAPEADLEALDPRADMRATLDIDSFDFLNLLIGVNERLGVEIPEADYGQLVSLDNIVAYILARG